MKREKPLTHKHSTAKFTPQYKYVTRHIHNVTGHRERDKRTNQKVSRIL